MLSWLILLALAFLLFYVEYEKSISILGYKARHFYISEGESEKMYNRMKEDGLPEESLKEFVMMEDRFLSLEKKSVCSQTSRKLEAFALSDEIKRQFLGYDFSYHTKHLKQISEPEKLINRNITCS
jgi:hypothetical protein